MRVVITDCDHGFFEPERFVIESAGHELVIAHCRLTDEVSNIAFDADALICQSVPITYDLLKSLPRCKVVGRYGVGIDNIDVSGATTLGVKVVNVPDFCSEEVASHTLGLILSLARQIVILNDRLKRDPEYFSRFWTNRMSSISCIERLSKQVLGIIGFGKIGRLVGTWAKELGFMIMVYDPYISDEIVVRQGMRFVSLDTLLKQADIVSLHIPLNSETCGMIGPKELAKMKPTAYLVNTSRGAVIKESALIEALQRQKVAGAALDVLEEEPFPADHPFFRMENVLLTPHIAYYSRTSIVELKTRVAQYVLNALTDSGFYPLANAEVQHARGSL